MDAELVEAVILLIFSSRFDRSYSEFIELLNDQKALLRQPLLIKDPDFVYLRGGLLPVTVNTTRNVFRVPVMIW